MQQITNEMIAQYRMYLVEEEKAALTREKYLRDVAGFQTWLDGRAVDKAIVLSYKQHLMEHHAPASVNSVLSALNSFFTYLEWFPCKVKTLKIQRQLFAASEKELSKGEYERLLTAAKQKKSKRLYYLMQTICATGIRVSEHRFITVEAAKTGRADIRCKGKMRVVILPKQLCRLLIQYARQQGIKTGSIFVSRSGKPLDRSNIWADMKRLCQAAGVSKEKVFPHNLRHLFARTYYALQKDIVRLADILGHSSVNTTRIYTMENGEIHRQQIQKLGLLRC